MSKRDWERDRIRHARRELDGELRATEALAEALRLRGLEQTKFAELAQRLARTNQFAGKILEQVRNGSPISPAQAATLLTIEAESQDQGQPEARRRPRRRQRQSDKEDGS